MTAASHRRAMAAGVAFVVLFVAGVFITFGDSPEVKKADTAASAAQKWTSELSTSGHRVGLLIGAYALILAAIAFVWFSNGLRERLGADTSSGRMVAALGVLGAGAIGVGALLGGAGFAGGVEFGESALPSGDAMRAVAELFFPFLFVIFGLASAALIVVFVTSAAEGTIPRWLTYAGWLAVLGAIAGVIFLPFVLPLLWFLAVAIVGLSRPAATPPPAASPPAAGPAV